ncbi:MAG: 3-hydroxyacyl-CoA dehydrogenase family protein [Cyclobacteriaceae bacterium]|nr:3-hydroxyacyl-CoA dehydrogenase family protein [Cyclobacteriaceae bacterium]MDH4294959.1 3-hydroxyacyl-CoA dehydrogenase family protein [Cyclobacteriaceae bacterium]MDH5250042.1 3-hydroxyacyl-CoA dehydrogenase family protein [Cyclobacteriaceae bacterium]
MNILVIGDRTNLQECHQKFGEAHQYAWVEEHRDAEKLLPGNDLVFDFLIDQRPHQFEIYCEHPAAVFLNTCKFSLAELVQLAKKPPRSKIFGFNGLPTFLNREVLEASLYDINDEHEMKRICDELNTDFLIVDDRVGLVTPRVICMIINEAYYTLQDGTATRADIDAAMILGTNYPYGPFEWGQRIGVKHVYELIEALYGDTHDPRYKICPLLKKEYLKTKAMNFPEIT